MPELVDCRQGRPADDLLAEATGTNIQHQVLTGLGGVGKTQVAAGLAHRRWNERTVDLLVWTTADSRATVLATYARAAERITGVDYPSPEEAAVGFLEWLAATTSRWMIVLDDLADPNDLKGLWPPVRATGRTIVTTRRREATVISGRHVIEVAEFTADEAVTYLRGKLSARPNCLPGVEELAADLGYLPLGLAQAVAYVLDCGPRMTCAQYRHDLANQRKKTLADLAPESLPDDHRATVAATWTLSIARAQQCRPVGLARPILELAAQLDPNGIPESVFATEAVKAYCSAFAGHAIGSDDIDQALGLLRRFSLLTVDEESGTVRVHGLLQRAVRDETPPELRRHPPGFAADALIQAWSGRLLSASDEQTLRSNAAALRQHSAEHLWNGRGGVHAILARCGTSLGAVGLVQEAKKYFQHLQEDAERELGADHLAIFPIRAHLANALRECGDFAGAARLLDVLWIELSERVDNYDPSLLSLQIQAAEFAVQRMEGGEVIEYYEDVVQSAVWRLGPRHPDTLLVRGTLADRRGRFGDPVRASAELEVILGLCKESLGPNHAVTRTTYERLTLSRARNGHSAAIEDLEELFLERERGQGRHHPDVLTLRKRILCIRYEKGMEKDTFVAALEMLLEDELESLGKDHPLILETCTELALATQGYPGVDQVHESADSPELLEILLGYMVRVFGPDHSHALTVRHNLAYRRGDAGDPGAAIRGLEAVLQERLRLLGADHPHTLTTRRNLALWRGRSGDISAAVAGHEQLLNHHLLTAGPEDPATAASLDDLWQALKSDQRSAIASYEERLAQRRHELGAEHPAVLETDANLAHWYGQAGDPTRAANAYRELLSRATRTYGPDHPGTLAVERGLAYWTGRSGKSAEAAARFEALLTRQRDLAGPDSPAALQALRDLAYWSGESGDLHGAQAAYEVLLEEQNRILGAEHPDTLDTRVNLAIMPTRIKLGGWDLRGAGPTA